MSNLLLINGPNLQLLGQREPNLYGASTLNEIEARLSELAKERNHKLKCFQSDAEHELVKKFMMHLMRQLILFSSIPRHSLIPA